MRNYTLLKILHVDEVVRFDGRQISRRAPRRAGETGLRVTEHLPAEPVSNFTSQAAFLLVPNPAIFVRVRAAERDDAADAVSRNVFVESQTTGTNHTVVPVEALSVSGDADSDVRGDGELLCGIVAETKNRNPLFKVRRGNHVVMFGGANVARVVPELPRIRRRVDDGTNYRSLRSILGIGSHGCHQKQ